VEGLTKSDMILTQLNSSSLAERIVEIDEAVIHLLIFQIGEYLFAFQGSQAKEILPFSEVTWIPGATALIPGVMNVRGDVVAVLDLRQILGIYETGQGPAAGFCVIIRQGDGRSGILVDNIMDVAALPVSANGELLPTLDERFRRFASSQIEYDHKIVTVLDAALILERVKS
jgi:purine-binding chemotaxis protein CheW